MDLEHGGAFQGDHQSSKNGRSSRGAPGPSSQAGFTIEDHLRDSLQSPAVRIVGAHPQIKIPWAVNITLTLLVTLSGHTHLE